MKLELRNVSMNYGKKRALDQISFKLGPCFCGLLGPNGAGKSTLIKILTGGLTATEGGVLCDGTPVERDLKGFLSQIGYMPQEQALYREFTALEYLDYMAALKGIPKKERAEQIGAVLRDVELYGERNDKLRTFSGGMRQRVMLAQAILGEPPLLILDEPMSGLDPGQRMRIRELLRRCGQRSIVLMATHIVADVEASADRVLLLSHGHLVGFDTLDALCGGVGAEKKRSLEEIYGELCGGGAEKDDADQV